MDLARQRLLQQRLIGSPGVRPEEVVKGLLAVQAQDFPGAKWAVLQRTASADDAEVQRAYDDGRILRTHVLRPTWHFVAPADIRWLLELSAPRVHAANAYGYRLFGIDKAVAKHSNARIVKALERSGQLTRAELRHVLGARDGDAKVNAAGTRDAKPATAPVRTLKPSRVSCDIDSRTRAEALPLSTDPKRQMR